MSTLAILSTVIVQFALETRLQYQLAVQARERLQAFYLAKSALQFSKLILVYNKQAESLLKQAGDAAKSLGAEPFYKMMPLSSELLRGILHGEIPGLGGKADTEDAEEPNPEDAKEKKRDRLKVGASLVDQEKAEEFLNFDGDFESEITEEQSKFDLNRFGGLETNSDAYDRRKKLLLSVLKLPQFQEILEEEKIEAETLTHALVDWVDAGGVINEFDKIERGDEDSLYTQVKYKPRNAKFLSLSELRLVSGMNDDLLNKLAPLISLYSGSDKINVCLADDELVKALVYYYTNYSECTNPLDYKDEEKLKELVGEVKGACPDTAAMANALNAKLGLGDASSSCKIQFKDLLTSDNQVFDIKAIGTVGEVRVTLHTVLNTQDNDPTRWKIYYYKIR